MVAIFFLTMIAAFPAAQDRAANALRWYALDLAESAVPVASVNPEQALAWSKEQGWSFSQVKISANARAIGYAGEERGFLWTLLGLAEAKAVDPEQELWLESPELGFRVAGLGTRVSGDKNFSLALLAPLPGRRWLLGVSSSASLDPEKLALNLKNPAVRKALALRLQNILRDGHAARNAGRKRPPRWGYPKLGASSLLEIGEVESEDAFAVQTTGETRRGIERLADGVTKELFIDDGLVLPPGASLLWTLDLQSLISDDLILFGTSAHGLGRGEILVDGVPLARWEPQPACASEFAEQWFESVVRIPNRLLAGKERAVFELRPDAKATISVFRIEFLRLPPPHGEYLSARETRAGSSPAVQGRAVGGCPLIAGGYRFFQGIGTTATSELVFEIKPAWREIETFVGVNDSSPSEEPVVFEIWAGNEMLARSKPLKRSDPPQTLRATLVEKQSIRLCAKQTAAQASREVPANWIEIRAFE